MPHGILIILWLEESHTAVTTGHRQDQADRFWRELNIFNRRVDILVECLIPGATRQYYIKFRGSLPVHRIGSLTTFSLLEDPDMLVHATRCDDLPELRVSPGNPPNRTIVLTLNLERAHPLVR